MREFSQFPEQAKCILCGSNTNKPCVLIPIDGTQEDNIEEAIPVHIDCLVTSDFRFSSYGPFIYCYPKLTLTQAKGGK